uniref:uncharacterized protein LOC122593843 n=1 Tax=Erigeron canadensis TaxID=72917 RepID=UPI001CB9A55D|nr:uncharacterized protein LOC122593843 [Erigeron canadensis]
MDITKVVNKNRKECHFDHNNTQQQPPPKKQVRRRLHSNKPYKERLMNMAEARREIATALKFHRASMKQQQATTSNHDFQAHQHSSTSTTNYLGTNYPFPNHWPISTNVPLPPPLPLMNHDNPDLVLPNQTLGLNLNFQDFNNLSTRIYHTPMSVCSSSSSPSTSSSVLKEVAIRGGGGSEMHHAIKKEVIMENGTKKQRKVASSHIDDDDNISEGNYDHPFEQVMEFPPWLINTNESSCYQDLFDHHLSHQYSPDPALPCMDIGEIEGMDGEWLA